MRNELSNNQLPFLAGGGAMGQLIRSKNWASTSLGTPDTWPLALKQLVAQVLTNPFPMLICWGTDYIQLYNDAFRPINGATKHPQALGGSARDTYAEIWETIGPMFAGVMQGQPVSFPNFMVPLQRNGYLENCYFDFSYSPVKDENAKILGVLVICVEVTARKALEARNDEIAAANEEMSAANEELAATNEDLSEAQRRLIALYQELESSEKSLMMQRQRLERFFMQAPAGICIFDGPEFTFELINPLYQQLFPGRNLLGKPLLEALPEVSDTQVLNILNDVYRTGKTFEGKGLLVPLAYTNNGPVENRYFDFIYQARLSTENRIDGILVFVIEVTETVVNSQTIAQSRDALQQAEQMLRSAVDAAQIATYSVDVAEQKIYPSLRLKELFGFKHDEEMPFEATLQLVTDEFRQQVSAGMRMAMEEGKDFHMEYQIRGGHNLHPRWVRGTGKTQRLANGQAFFSGALIDITDQKAQEAKLKEGSAKNAQLAAIVSSSDDTIISKTLKGIITSWNNAAEAMFGYTAEEAIGKHISLLIPPDHLAEEDYIISQISQGKKVDHFETIRLSKDGRLIPISLTISPITDDEGNIIGASKIARDISSQKEAQETAARLYEQIKVLNDKKDEFIGLASHELKTPLTSIKGYLQILSRMHTDPNSKRFVDKTLQQLNKLTALVNDLLDVSKIEAGKLRFKMYSFDLKPLVEDAIELIQHSTNKYIISFNTHEEKCIIVADSQRIEQVVINLLSNAIKYSPGADTVEVSLYCAENQVTVSIRDYGLGIASDKLTEIFSRFYRVDDASPNISGLGIGLYLSHEIIERHQGKLWVESEPGKGSTFHFTLPIAGTA